MKSRKHKSLPVEWLREAKWKGATRTKNKKKYNKKIKHKGEKVWIQKL